jgi:GntR family transcriptional repressor for pyruvate dehydrogenase complex
LAKSPPLSLPPAVSLVREYIERAGFKPGDRLPIERQLAVQLGIGLSKLREAMNTLQQMGVVDRRRKAGTFLKEADARYLAAHVGFHVEMGTHNVDEIRRARAALESGIAAQAAEHASALDRLHILAAIEEEETILARAKGQESIDSKLWFKADWAFHDAVLRASHNTILDVFGKVITESFARQPQAMRLRYGPPARLVIAEHREIFEAISARNVDQAQLLMYHHVTVQKPIEEGDPA